MCPSAHLFDRRIFPLDGGRPGRESDLALSVPYSTFVKHVRKDQVSAVVVDGSSVNYRLRQDSAELKRMKDVSDVAVARSESRPLEAVGATTC